MHGFDAAYSGREVLSTLGTLVRSGKCATSRVRISPAGNDEVVQMSDKVDGRATSDIRCINRCWIPRDYEYDSLPPRTRSKSRRVDWSPLGW